ncbi:MAG: tRNA (guanine-N1)-methyltransferase [Halothece sp.]
MLRVSRERRTLSVKHQEGKATFDIGNAFYRPNTKFVRDLGILAAAAYQQETGRLRVLDAMAGCGVRALRYALEAGADWVWVNEANADIHDTLKANLSHHLDASQYCITHLDANRLFFDRYNHFDFYDLIDVDSFGAPVPDLSTVLWATKFGGLVYITSTDGRAFTGNAPQNCLKFYNAYARSHPAAHEQGLRLIMGSLQQQAGLQGRGIKPVFAYFTGETYRVMMRFVPKPQLTEDNYGWLGYCHHCGNYQLVDWRKLGRTLCPFDGKNPVVSGPMWLGDLHDRAMLEKMIALARNWEWWEHLALLQVMAQEADFPPYFYSLKNIGKTGKLNLPKRDALIRKLQEQGYRACTTHLHSEAIKTDASFTACIETAKAMS